MERTCIGCRTVAQAEALVRLVAPDGVVTVASRGASGRGAWLHASAECVAAAVKTRAFARAFRRQVVSPESEVLLTAVIEEDHDRKRIRAQGFG